MLITYCLYEICCSVALNMEFYMFCQTTWNCLYCQFCTRLICNSPALKWLIGTSCCPPLLLLAVDFTHSKPSTVVEKEISLRFWLSFQQFYSSFWVLTTNVTLLWLWHLIFKHRKTFVLWLHTQTFSVHNRTFSSTKNEHKLHCVEKLFSPNIFEFEQQTC